MSATIYRAAHCHGSTGTRWMSIDESGDTDGALLTAVARGDVRCFERFYARFERRMYQYALNFVRDSSSAEEIVVDSMLAVWNGAAGYLQTALASTWVLGIVRHKALDAVRRQQRHRDQVPLDLAAEVSDTSRGPYDSANDATLGNVMHKAMHSLSEDHREILFLTFYEDLSYAEISSLLSIPENTAKTRAHYAKLKLREHLTRLEPEGALP
jgi:RNA polymerase sigma-70 factor, ECF subfamily